MISTGGKGGLKSRLRRKESGDDREDLTMMIMMTMMVIMMKLIWDYEDFTIFPSRREIANSNERRRMQSINSGEKEISSWSPPSYHHDRSPSFYHHDHHHLIIMITIMIMIRILKILSRVRLPPHASPPPWGGKAVQGCHSPTDGWVSFHFTFLMVWNTSYFKLPIKSWYINDFLLG